MTFLTELLGDYYYSFIVRSASMIEMFCCVIFFTHGFTKKTNFLCRFMVSILTMFCLLYPITIFHTNFPSVLTNIVITMFCYLFYLLMLYFLYEEPFPELLLTICSGIATQIIVGKLFEFLYILVGKNPYQSLSFFPDGTLPSALDWTIYFLLHFVFIILLSRLFRRKKRYSYDPETRRLIVIFSFIITIVTIPLTSYSRTIEPLNLNLAMVIRIFSTLYGFLVLFLRTGIIEQGRSKAELRILNELLYAEKKQFEDIKEDIELINIRCHDIRSQLNHYAGKLTDKELKEIQSTIQIYDASLKTGNEILDVILYKKQPFCRQNHIQISCIADGVCLDFISPAHLYSLLNNALENAIEAVIKLDNPEMRIISLTIGLEHGITAIHVTNYFEEKNVISDNFQQTSKEDTSRHGFGIKSMRYIAEQYDGRVSIEIDGQIFYLHMFFPSKF